jgi:GT2 family glycosyltransferase
MAVYDTEENNRTWMTKATLQSLYETVDFNKHRLVISDNGSCDATLKLYDNRKWSYGVTFNGKNIGTANAINQAWQRRRPGEHAVKMDNDVVIHQAGWADWIEDVFDRDPTIGICGLKRRDLDENPFDGSSVLRMLPHEKGQRWITVEEVEHVIGTCQGFSSALLDRIGFLNQPGLYGFDDSLASVRARVAGFKRCFLVGFDIDHIDPGGSDFNKWKIGQANKDFDDYKMLACEYEMGIKDVYHDGL